jgi:hypothetical protein
MPSLATYKSASQSTLKIHVETIQFKNTRRYLKASEPSSKRAWKEILHDHSDYQ